MKWGSTPRGAVSLWVIYDHPRDHPAHFVVRRWVMVNGHLVATHEHTLRLTLEDARADVPAGLYRTARAMNDDPKIVETWL